MIHLEDFMEKWHVALEEATEEARKKEEFFRKAVDVLENLAEAMEGEVFPSDYSYDFDLDDDDDDDDANPDDI